jgi:hypothetical protein
VDLVERAGHLKPMLVDFALSPRFDRELSAVIARNFPDGLVTDESAFSMILDHFALQHRLRSGNTVVEAFAAAHPELTDAERDMLLGWRDVVEGVFDIAGKHLAEQARPGAELPEIASLDLPDDILAADSVAIHFAAGEGLSFYPRYHLLEELFSAPALVSRRRYRETLSGFLRDPDTSPEPLRRLAARDPAKASTVFTKLLNRKRGFSWDIDGEQLLRQHKPSYFDGTLLPEPSRSPNSCPTHSGTRIEKGRRRRSLPVPRSADGRAGAPAGW